MHASKSLHDIHLRSEVSVVKYARMQAVVCLQYCDHIMLSAASHAVDEMSPAAVLHGAAACPEILTVEQELEMALHDFLLLYHLIWAAGVIFQL